jgi:hypothetical protein
MTWQEEETGHSTDPWLLDGNRMRLRWKCQGQDHEFDGVAKYRPHPHPGKVRKGRKRKQWVVRFDDGDERRSNLIRMIAVGRARVVGSTHVPGRFWTPPEADAAYKRFRNKESLESIGLSLNRSVHGVRNKLWTHRGVGMPQSGAAGIIPPLSSFLPFLPSFLPSFFPCLPSRLFIPPFPSFVRMTGKSNTRMAGGGWRRIARRALESFPGKQGTVQEVQISYNKCQIK